MEALKVASVTVWKDISHLCWLSLVVDTTWFGGFSNIAHRYRKSISIIETYSINFFSSPLNCHKLANNVPYLTNVRPESGCSEEWAIIGMPTIRCISEQLWVMTCNKNCCDTFIQMKWVLFPIAMNRPSGYNPICCPAISAKLRCFEIPCQVWGR